MTRRAEPLARIYSGDPAFQLALDPVREGANRLRDEIAELRRLIPTVTTPWSINSKPSSPHPYDDEFDGTVLDQRWRKRGGFVTTAIDPYAAYTTADTTRWSHNSYRADWLMLQPTADNAIYGLYQAVTLPTNISFLARLSFNYCGAGIANNDSEIGISLCADTGGAPDIDNRLALYLNESDANTVQVQWDRVAGGATVTTYNGADHEGIGSAYEYVMISKIGTAYHAWAGTAGGSWTYANASNTAPATLVWLMIHCRNNATTGPGNKLQGCDFIRAIESAVYLP